MVGLVSVKKCHFRQKWHVFVGIARLDARWLLKPNVLSILFQKYSLIEPLLLSYGILFAEAHIKIFNHYSSIGVSGIFLRQLWSFFCALMVAFFSSILLSSVTLKQSPPMVQSNEEAMKSNRPVILSVANKVELEDFKNSPLAVDNWLYDNAQTVYFWGTYVTII